MKFLIEARWPSSDILPQAEEAANATAGIKACAAFVRAGCVISRVERTADDGGVSTINTRELLRLARAEGCGIRFPPRRRAPRQSLARVLFAILCLALPNNFGDLTKLTEMSTNRIAVRRSEGARTKAIPRPLPDLPRPQ